MKGALVILGTFFREGLQFDNKKDTDSSFETQKKATESHVRFAKHFKMDILIHAYPTKWENELKNWYSESTYTYTVHPEKYDVLEQLLNKCEISNEYDYIFVIRSDLFLKDLLFEKFNPNWQRIMFPSICWAQNATVKDDRTGELLPRVSDTMLFVPQKYIKNPMFMSHDAWLDYIKIGVFEMNFILDTFHDSDSFKDFNPLYYFVGRPECQVVNSGNLINPLYRPD